MTNEVPKDLTELEYARNILEEKLGWPIEGNLKTVASCIKSISRCKAIPMWQAYKYLVRAITLATEQGVLVSKFWLLDGEYMRVRPPAKPEPKMERTDWEALARHKASPEYEPIRQAIRELSKKLGMTKGTK